MTVTKEKDTKPGYCQCGRPLHYSDKSIKQMVDRIVGSSDPFVTITILGVGKFRVQRHFLALHGFSARVAVDYGFEQVKGTDAGNNQNQNNRKP